MEWIPCKEKLPEEESYYLATFKGDIYSGNFIDFVYYDPKRGWSEDPGSSLFINVLAWMPLMEPYE